MATLTSIRPVSLRSVTRATEPQLFYAPPYASPDHDSLAWALVRHLNPAAALREVKRAGNAAFMIEMEERRVCIELVEDTIDVAEKDRKSTRLNSSHVAISHAVLSLKTKQAS